ncbi:MAG TPA: methyltransferase [Pseudomonadales bacterium]|nr:methyltransferase [Pseudomonadales bacterium]
MLHDSAFDALLPFLQRDDGNTLWVADESALSAMSVIISRTNLSVISNRFDVAAAAMAAGHLTTFSDFDFSLWTDGSVQRIVYRISKEKPLVHHVLNHARRLLAPDGELIIAGFKSDGTKTYIEKCKQLFGNGSIQKSGLVYRGLFSGVKNSDGANLLDDRDYEHLRMMHTPQLDFYSKPGLFGWDRIDTGSAFLIDSLQSFLASLDIQPQSLLDLGCGYGFLTLMTRDLPCVRRVATDNNAAALSAIKRNADHYDIAVDVVADDAGKSLSGSFELVLCNPPFHQGFSVAGDLTDRFLASACRLLSSQGAALFVVNTFIGIEKKAAEHFPVVKILANNGSFKLVLLQK